MEKIWKKEVEKFGGKILFTNNQLHSSSALANNVFNYLMRMLKHKQAIKQPDGKIQFTIKKNKY